VEGQPPAVIGDRLKVYQIFSNLIGNAIKYRSDKRPLQIVISAKPSKNERYINISVSDNGLGIPKHKRELIFRPFQRAHGKSIEGSGIGLACVKKLLEKLGGEIEVQSQEDAGSVFTFTLRADRSRWEEGSEGP
jgi:signal transduction histidine kinase